MQRPALRFCIVALLLAVAMPAFAALPLDGWNGYKFGMSPNATRAVPGIAFGKYSAKNLMDQDVGAMSAQNPIRINGIAFSLDLIFEPPKTLTKISMANEAMTTQPGCETRFIGMLSFLEKIYGGFAPFNPQRQKKNDQDELPSTVVWKSHAGLRYQLTTVPLPGETGYVWAARKADGKRSLDVAATWISKDGDTGVTCLINMDFSGS